MITFDEKNKIFHLFNNDISYILKIHKNGEIGSLYFGKRIHSVNFDYMYKSYISLPITTTFGNLGDGFYLDTLLREYPDFGTGDYRIPAFEIVYGKEHTIVEFLYDSYEIIDGYVGLSDLPHLKINEAKTLLIHLVDKEIKTKITLKYTISDKFSAIVRNVSIDGENITINKALSMNLDLIDKEYDLIQLSGFWGREATVIKTALATGIKKISSTRGTSSATNNPFIALARKNADFNNGEMIGFNLIYSGNFEANIEVSPQNITRVNMGINSSTFYKKDKFISPEVLIVYSDKGLNKLSQTYHDIYRNYLLPKKENLVLLNNWEGTHFDFDEKKIIAMIEEAKQLGIDLFVLDDGWFGNRDNDKAGLGDWTVNLKKLPNGLKPLWQKTKELGMKFGIWIEPEMINMDSNLYKEHPEYIIHTKNRKNHMGRNQFNLDFSNDEVVEHIYIQLEKILDENEIDYIKWDMNKCITGIDDMTKYPKYVENLYKLIKRIKERYKDILIEGCASGGNRFDPGILYYCPQIWGSDNTDAGFRLDIQFGLSIPYPLSTIGSHVSDIPNEQSGRNISMEFRRNVSMFGTFGYELDPQLLSLEDKEYIKKDIKLYKEHADLISNGDLYRIIHNDEISAFNVVSKDKTKSILAYFRRKVKVCEEQKRVNIMGLINDRKYTVNRILKSREYEKIGEFTGDFLEKFGLFMQQKFSGSQNKDGTIYSDFDSDIYIIESI